MVLSTLGTPVENIVMAAEMSIPRNPQVIARGSTPKPGALYEPVLIRRPIHSPAVERIPNLRKLITNG